MHGNVSNFSDEIQIKFGNCVSNSGQLSCFFARVCDGFRRFWDKETFHQYNLHSMFQVTLTIIAVYTPMYEAYLFYQFQTRPKNALINVWALRLALSLTLSLVGIMLEKVFHLGYFWITFNLCTYWHVTSTFLYLFHME